jgi:hypothetical protein
MQSDRASWSEHIRAEIAERTASYTAEEKKRFKLNYFPNAMDKALPVLSEADFGTFRDLVTGAAAALPEKKALKQKEFARYISFITKAEHLLKDNYKLTSKGAIPIFWMPLGVGIGLPFGAAFGNIAYGIPFGMAIGVLVGQYLEKKAIAEGRVIEY